MTDRQHEPIAIRPDRILGIEAQEVLPQRVDDRRHRHRRTGMPGLGLLHGVHRQGSNGVDRKLIEVESVCVRIPVSRYLAARLSDLPRTLQRALDG